MSRYALRAGARSGGSTGGRRPSGGLLLGTGTGIGGDSGGNASSLVHSEAAALAALDAGLLPSSLSKEEMRRFATVGPSEYLEARSLVLSLWASDPTVELTSEACVAAAAAADPSSSCSSSSSTTETAELVKEAHRYLSLIGAINFGLIRTRGRKEKKKEPSPPAPAPAPPPDATSVPSDAALLSALAAELAAADMTTTTEKLLRKKLEAKFGGVDLSERKQLLRAGVERFLAGESVVLEEEEKEKKEEEKKEEEEVEEAPPLCRPGASAVVVGAGPAGLGAALHLSRCGVRVTVLEARDRAGGRAHSVAAARGEGEGGGEKGKGLASAVADFGASIVTGVAPDFRGDAALSANATAGRRSDPSALLARQLGAELHPLGESLPLFDPLSPPSSSEKEGGTGKGKGGRQVPKEADERADTMRDALLDDAKDAAFHSSSEAAAAASGEKKRTLGEFLEASLAARLSAASKRRAENGDNGGENGGEHAAAAAGEAAAARERAAFASASETELRLLDWHWANLEYGCAAPLSRVCLSHWNQDDTFGGFGGGHAMVVGGYGALLERAAERLAASSSSSSLPPSSENGGGGGASSSSPSSPPLVDLRLSTPVKSIRWGDSSDGGGSKVGVVVVTAAGKEVSADVAIVTVPLGVLKASVGGDEGEETASAASISFDPPLPPWKADAVRALGFGKLEKVFLEFEGERFWPEGVDYFGVLQPTATTAAVATAEKDGDGGDDGKNCSSSSLLLSRDPTAAELARGRAFMFWDVGRFQPGSPAVLAALFSGAAAERFLGEGSGGTGGGGGGEGETASASAVEAALASLRSAFGSDAVPDAVASLTTSWGSDPFAGRGAYSFVPPGASGITYDLLARPCSRRLLFAGEHTCREHPDTVGGAMLSGVREAARALGWGGLLGNAEADGEEALRRRRRHRQRGGGAEGESSGESSSSSSSTEDGSSSSSDDDDDDDDEDDVNDEERNERRREAAEAALLSRRRKKKKSRKVDDGEPRRKKEKEKKEKKPRRQPRREAAAGASSPDGRNYARTAEQAEELDARAAAAERADARSLWGALALAAAPGKDPRARRAFEALSAADAAPHRRAVALRCLTTADAPSLAALARNPGIVKMLSGWTEEAARASAGASSSSSYLSSSSSSAAAIAADGARVLGSLPLPAAERGPSGAERAVRAVAAQCRGSESARAAAGAVLDSWFGKEAKGGGSAAGVDEATAAAAEAALKRKKPEPPAAPVISDDALPPELRARLLEAERAAAEAAEHAAAAERIEAQLAAARAAAAAAAASKAPVGAAAGAAGGAAMATAAAAVAAPVVADIGDFDAYLAARAKEEAKRRGLKRRKDAAAAALAAAEAEEEEEEEAREREEAKDDDGDGEGAAAPAAKKRDTAPAPPTDEAALLQEITAAVRACVSAALKRRLKLRKERLSKEQVDAVARKAAAKVVEAEMDKRREARGLAADSGKNPGPPPPPKFRLTESKEEKIKRLVEGYVKAAAAAGK